MSVQEKRLKLYQESNQNWLKLLTQSTEREDYLKEKVKYWNDAYENINQEHLALKYGSVCYDRIKRKEETEEGKAFVPCTECGEKRKSKRDLQGRIDKLEEEVHYWQGCYKPC